MAEKLKYEEIISRARERRKKEKQIKCIAAASVAVIILGVAGVRSYKSLNKDAAEAVQPSAVYENAEVTQQTDDTILISQEDLDDAKIDLEKRKVVDDYENLGFVNVSGYLNIRKTPGPNGDIIGKLMQNSACEILGQEGEWYYISSGDVEGYVHGQYVMTGEEAAMEAFHHVENMAIVTADKLNIRTSPELDPLNVSGMALKGERYPIDEVMEGWVHTAEGYMSSEYIDQKYALNEARKLDLREMALNQYDNLVISKVNNYLNIRSSADSSSTSNFIGKFPGKAAGEILETLDGWYKIKSGPITGYITADPQYVAVAQEAKDLAMQAASLTAIVTTDMLNVRMEPTTDSKIWTQISKEERYHVLDQLDGWVQIDLDTGDNENDSDKAYISTRDNNVEVRYALTEAIKFSPLEEKANKDNSSRSKLVNYALKFVGGRYVWGGTNPNTGADCSGFVQYVYRNAMGISLPRTSREQSKAGTSLKSGEMKPGDLIFYTNSGGTVNHVAMYIGNGQVVHAASRKSGIKISTWNYRKPKVIKRFF